LGTLDSRSDRPGEFCESSRDPLGGRSLDTELVVPAAQVLHEGMPADDDLRCPVGCGVPLLSPACDLGSVGHYASDGVLELSVFKVRGVIPECVQATRATRSGSETKGQVRGPDEFSAPTTRAGLQDLREYAHPFDDVDGGPEQVDGVTPRPVQTDGVRSTTVGLKS
jgi:hypothetical protein